MAAYGQMITNWVITIILWNKYPDRVAIDTRVFAPITFPSIVMLLSITLGYILSKLNKLDDQGYQVDFDIGQAPDGQPKSVKKSATYDL